MASTNVRASKAFLDFKTTCSPNFPNLIASKTKTGTLAKATIKFWPMLDKMLTFGKA